MLPTVAALYPPVAFADDTIACEPDQVVFEVGTGGGDIGGGDSVDVGGGHH